MPSRPCSTPAWRAAPNWLCASSSAAPTAPPASPEAGWIQIWLRFDRRCSSRPFATQLSATPPARQRLRLSASRRARRAEAKHRLLDDRLGRGGNVHVFDGDRRFRIAPLAAEQLL